MALIHDVMPTFDLYQPASIDDALELIKQHGTNAWIMAGGLDTFDWLKDRTKRTPIVVDLSQVAELRGIKEVDGGVEIGATTPLVDVVNNPVIKAKFSLLSDAAALVASPQIRNQGTIGGNVSQDTRCWYYRSGWSCYRAGGNICYADTPASNNREHAILHASRCVAVSPSDTAPALVALDASMVIRRAGGKERVVKAEDYFVGPAVDIVRMNALQPGELLVAIRVPSTWAGAQFYFEKVRDRQVWDFPLMNVASAIKGTASQIEEMRIAVGAVAATPVRLTAVEAAVAGKPRNEATATMAGELAIKGAEPLRYNAYKVPLMRNLVKRAIRGPGGEAPVVA